MDKRARHTQILIENSFLDLLKNNNLSKITVKSICENAGINRITFYKHYSSSFDLYEKLVNEAIEEIAKKMKEKYDNCSLKEAIRSAFQDVYDNSEKYILLFSSNIDNLYRLKSFELCFEKLTSLNIDLPKVDKNEQEFLKKFLSFGGGGILSLWLKNGKKERPTEIADKLYNLIELIIKSYSLRLE